MKERTTRKKLTSLPVFHDFIPLREIFNILEDGGMKAVQEDGRPWEGIICGETGHTTFDLVETKTNKPLKFVLVLDWYTMPITGRIEINTYLS